MFFKKLDFSCPIIEGACGFEAYNNVYGSSVDIDHADGHFKAIVQVLGTTRMVMYERHVSGVQHSRTAARVRRDDYDHIALHLLLSGEFVTGPMGVERRLMPGEIMVVDTYRPHKSRMKEAHVISVQLAREHVRSILKDVDHLHGTVLPAKVAGLLSDFMLSLLRRAEALPPNGADHAARAMIELLGLALSGLPITTRVLSHEAADPIRRGRAEAFIAAQLTDSSLDVKAVALGIGTSRSTLYKLFSDDGGIARYIQRQRLDAVRKALLRPSEDRSLSNLAYAFGFSNERHLSRLFAAAFGAPPGRFRVDVRRARLVGFGSGEASNARLTRWASELY